MALPLPFDVPSMFLLHLTVDDQDNESDAASVVLVKTGQTSPIERLRPALIPAE